MRPATAASVLVVADDLTGAADSAVGFAAAGLKTVVLLDPAEAGWSAEQWRWEVIAVDTDTRRTAPAVAEEAMIRVAGMGQRAENTLVYKKIDSTLRGNTGIEIRALLRALGLDLALVAPAFPATGRITRGGVQYEHGVSVRSAEHDIELPTTPDLVSLLSRSGLDARLVSTAVVRAGVHGLTEQLLDLSKAQTDAAQPGDTNRSCGTAAVVDAESDDDLRVIAKAGQRATEGGTRLLWVGTGGLAAHLPGALGLHGSDAGGAAAPPAVRGPVLTLVGSATERAHGQSDALRAHPAVQTVELDPETRPGRKETGGDPVAEAGLETAAALGVGQDVLLTFTGPVTEPTAEAARRAVRALARAAAYGMTSGRPAALVVTGGETARALFAQLEIRALQIVNTLLPGVAWGFLGDKPGTVLVTKAGSFGERSTLVDVLDALHGKTRQLRGVR